ncbi:MULTISPECIES: hypothetical protein [Citrobacter]|uniref:hypothetical protein n=1 Tax=Citrobacter TaxID=544 RepID=UPI00241784DE|nr:MULTISPECIES: hypothetical protein [Citrobacter]MDM3428836.1 hypothetical protein [Citrobacter sp. Cb023]WFO41405.1 hypothetical protein MJ613_14350 [Citrobacter braakii]
MTTNNHPANGPVSLDRLHQISEILSKAAAQSDGGNLGYAMADAVKVIDVAIAAFGAEPVAWTEKCEITNMQATGLYLRGFPDNSQGRDIALYTAPPAPVVPDELLSMAASAIEDLLEHTDPSTSYYSGVWADVPGKLRDAMLQAGNSPVTPDGWKVEAEQLAEIHGCSFVVFRHGEEPQCADPTKVILSFSDEGLGHHSAAPQQEVNRG